MSIRSVGSATFHRTGAATVLGTLLALGACSTDKVSKPSLSGPSELAIALGLAASPDVLTADGRSTAAVQAVVHDQNGHTSAGVPITFALLDSSGTFADIGALNTTSAVTGPDGTATVIYRAPFRTDFTANGTVQVGARPLGTDARSAIYRTVAIELRSAEGRLFPPKDNNTLPNCGIVVEAPNGFKTGQDILFQTASNDPDGTIVRYFWTFGDDSPTEDLPDVNHAYKVAGSYTVTHIVTDNNGGQKDCTVAVTITD
jgi:PKD domain-containing protein